jgi:hypothetical protein
LPKLYYPTPDEIHGTQPLNELIWFEQYQPLLVALANTHEGRDLLCIDPYRTMPYPIVSIRKNSVKYFLGQENGRDNYATDFRVGAKWGNVIRYRWSPIKKALDRMNLELLLALPQYVIHNGRSVPVPMGAATTTVYPDAHTESTTVDGTVQWLGPQQSGHDAGFETIRTTATGTDINDGATGTNYAQTLIGSGAGANWQHISRAITLFNTADIDDGDDITSATYSIWGSYDRRDYGQDIGLVRLSALDSNTAIVVGDYDAFINATTAGDDMIRMASDIAQSTLSTGAYDDFTFNATGIAEIDKTGVTRVGVTMSSDIENDVSGFSQSVNGNSNWNFHTAEYTGTSRDPKLAVVHAAPFTPRAIIF